MDSSFARSFQSLVSFATVRRVALSSGASLVAQVLSAIGTVLMARHLAPESYGYIAAAAGAVGTLGFLFNWGLDPWLLRNIPRIENPNQHMALVLVARLLLWAIVFLPIALLLPIVEPRLYIGTILLAILFDSAIESIARTLHASALGSNAILLAAITAILLRAIRLVVVLVLIGLDVTTPAIFLAARTAISLLVLVPALSFLNLNWLFKFADLARLLKSTLPFVASEMVTLLYLQADLSLVGLLLKSPIILGNYAAAVGLISFILTLPVAVGAVLLPSLSRHAQTTEPPQRLYGAWKRHAVFGVAFGCLLSLMTYVFAGRIAQAVFGADYQLGGTLMVALSPIIALKSSSIPHMLALTASGQQTKRLAIQFVAAIVSIALNLYAVPRWGVMAVPASQMISECLLLVLAFGAVRKFVFGRQRA